MHRIILSGGDVVLPDRVIGGGSVVIEDGRIAEVVGHAVPASHAAGETHYDLAGRMVMPGIVDLHNDSLETEISPRPKASLPVALALASLDRRLSAAGVTTEFDAIFFADMTRNDRKLDEAPERVRTVADHVAGGHALVDHHVLFRIDVWSPASMELALATIDQVKVPLLSLNDHTPGQGQYRDVANFKLYFERQLGLAPEEVEQITHDQMDRAVDAPQIAEHVFRRAREAVDQGRIILMSHDDDTVEKVDFVHALGVRVAEFPVTIEAARRQRELGMHVSVGAPNVVRGGSATGNVSAGGLIAQGLVDILCADYHAPSILAAVLQAPAIAEIDLPRAVRMATLNPAQAVGIDGETGSLEAGKRADVIAVNPFGPVAVVELTLRGGEISYYSPARGR